MWSLIGAMDMPTDIRGMIKRCMARVVILEGANRVLKGIKIKSNLSKSIRCPDFPTRAHNIHRNLQETLLRWATSCKYMIQKGDQQGVDYIFARFLSYESDVFRYRYKAYIGPGQSNDISDGALYVLLYDDHPVPLTFSAVDYLSAENFWVVTKRDSTYQECVICGTLSNTFVLVSCDVCSKARALFKASGKGASHIFAALCS